jgi:hypothetical protein
MDERREWMPEFVIGGVEALIGGEAVLPASAIGCRQPQRMSIRSLPWVRTSTSAVVLVGLGDTGHDGHKVPVGDGKLVDPGAFGKAEADMVGLAFEADDYFFHGIGMAITSPILWYF